MAQFGTVRGELTLTIAGTAVGLGAIEVPLRGYVSGSTLRLSVDVGEIRDAVEALFDNSAKKEGGLDG